MKNRFFKALSVALLLLATIFTMSACGKKDKAIATIDGFKIESIAIMHIVDDYYNMEIGVTNTNNATATFDFAQIVLKFDGREIAHDGDEKEYGANKYWKWSIQLDTGHGLSVGDVVEVYYGEQKLKDVKVVELQQYYTKFKVSG